MYNCLLCQKLKYSVNKPYVVILYPLTLLNKMKKGWFKPAFNTDSINLTTSPSLNTSMVNGSKKRNFSASEVIDVDNYEPIHNLNCLDFNSSNWIQNFSPKNISDLAVHVKKIEEIQDWFSKVEEFQKQCPGPILLVSGPSGVGKTETIHLVAKELKYEINEWINPMDADLVQFSDYGYNNNIFRENQIDIFQEFLFKASRYSSLFNLDGKKLLLVEDFPNFCLRNSEKFFEILGRYGEFGKSPLVFIATETRSKQLNIIYNLFPENIRIQHKIAHISFNPVSTTLMKKGLKRISYIMSQPGFSKYYSNQPQDVIDSIIVASQGDIRSAVLNLHFASQKNALKLRSDLNTTLNNNKTKVIKFKKFSSIGRDETITLMHALGRVLNPKYITNESSEKVLTHSPEDLADSFSSQPTNFISFIHANYLEHFDVLENVAEVSKILCDADVYVNEYREDVMAKYGLNISVRGTMVLNSKPISGWKPVKGPKRKVDFNTSSIEEQKLLKLSSPVANRELALDYRTYIKIINLISK